MRAAVKFNPKQKAEEGQQQKEEGLGRGTCPGSSSLLTLRASHCPSPLSPHTSSPAMSVFRPQTRASGRASQPGSTESRALLCGQRGSWCRSGLPVSPHPQGCGSGPLPSALLLVGQGGWCPLALPSASAHCPDQWLSNRATVLFPSLCKFKFCSLVVLTSSWPTS